MIVGLALRIWVLMKCTILVVMLSYLKNMTLYISHAYPPKIMHNIYICAQYHRCMLLPEQLWSHANILWLGGLFCQFEFNRNEIICFHRNPKIKKNFTVCLITDVRVSVIFFEIFLGGRKNHMFRNGDVWVTSSHVL